MTQRHSLMRTCSAPALSASRVPKPRGRMRTASMREEPRPVGQLARVGPDPPLAEGRTLAAVPNPPAVARRDAPAAGVMEIPPAIRHLARPSIALLAPDFRDEIRRASMAGPTASSKRVDIVLARPVTRLSAPTATGERHRRAFDAEIMQLAAVEHRNLLKPLGMVIWNPRESFIPLEDGSAAEHADLRYEHTCPLVSLVWEGGFRDNLQRFACDARPEDVFAVLRDVACGLLELHRNNLSHGNVCLENIVVTADDRGKLGDFRRASCLEPVRDLKVDRVAAPELILERWERGVSTCRSFAGDVYSLAMTGIAVLTGELRFGVMTDDEIIENLQISAEFERPDGVSDEVWTRLSPMLNADPSERPSMEGAYTTFHALSGEAL